MVKQKGAIRVFVRDSVISIFVENGTLRQLVGIAFPFNAEASQ